MIYDGAFANHFEQEAAVALLQWLLRSCSTCSMY